MTREEICEQFEVVAKKSEEYQKFCEKKFGKGVIDDIKQRCWALCEDKEFREEQGENIANVFEKIVAAINDSLSEDSPEVQTLMQQYYNGGEKSISSVIPRSIAKEMYLSGREWMCKECCDVFAQLHPKLPDFLYKAMGIFADRSFPKSDS